MRQRRIKFAPGFDRSLRKLSLEDRERTIEAIRHFIDRTAENSLRPEKKHGLQGISTFRVTDSLRAFYVQKRDREGTYSEIFLVGRHDDYRTIGRKKQGARRLQK
jgi:hypothetical protein